MNYLETRVQGLEMVLEDISFDLGLTSGRFPNRDSLDNKRCKLPGADFLSSKFWRKDEGRYFNSRLSSVGSIRTGNEAFKQGGERFWNQNTDALAEKRVGDLSSRRSQLRDADRVQLINSSMLDGTHIAAPLAVGNGSLTSRYHFFSQ